MYITGPLFGFRSSRSPALEPPSATAPMADISTPIAAAAFDQPVLRADNDKTRNRAPRSHRKSAVHPHSRESITLLLLIRRRALLVTDGSSLFARPTEYLSTCTIAHMLCQYPKYTHRVQMTATTARHRWRIGKTPAGLKAVSQAASCHHTTSCQTLHFQRENCQGVGGGKKPPPQARGVQTNKLAPTSHFPRWPPPIHPKSDLVPTVSPLFAGSGFLTAGPRNPGPKPPVPISPCSFVPRSCATDHDHRPPCRFSARPQAALPCGSAGPPGQRHPGPCRSLGPPPAKNPAGYRFAERTIARCDDEVLHRFPARHSPEPRPQFAGAQGA